MATLIDEAASPYDTTSLEKAVLQDEAATKAEAASQYE